MFVAVGWRGAGPSRGSGIMGFGLRDVAVVAVVLAFLRPLLNPLSIVCCEAAALNLLFVCTGNTCRSPMAEVIARDLLRDDAAAVVGSAGVTAGMGAQATPQAVEAAHELGLDLNAHRSRPLTAEMVAGADRILTMTQAHRDMVLRVVPEAAERTVVLDDDGDIADPFGGPLAEYRVTAEQIKTALLRRLGEPML